MKLSLTMLLLVIAMLSSACGKVVSAPELPHVNLKAQTESLIGSPATNILLKIGTGYDIVPQDDGKTLGFVFKNYSDQEALDKYTHLPYGSGPSIGFTYFLILVNDKGIITGYIDQPKKEFQ